MPTRLFSALLLALGALVVAPPGAEAQLRQTEAWVSHVSNEYRVIPNVTYHVANNQENSVDLYLPRNTTGPTPVFQVHPRRRLGRRQQGAERAAAAPVS